MKEMDNYGLKLCQFQAELFQKSINETKCSSKIFIRRFMLSDIAKRMDKIGFLYNVTDTVDAFMEIENQFGASDYGIVKFEEEELYWIGYIYRYWAYITGMSSKQLYRLVKPEELKKVYFPYHSLDPALAIERIKEAKQMTEEDDIKRGVAILRKIRNNRKG